MFLAVVAIAIAGGAVAWWAADNVTPMSYVGVFILVIAGWLVSLCLHEFGHAYTAWRFSGPAERNNVEARGYLTLNPLKYTHPMLSLGLPVLFIALGGIGFPGGAVYLRTARMTPRQKTLVSLAGPAANLALGIILLAVTSGYFDPAHSVFWSGLAFLGFLQVTALVLNLLPIPGLDGYGALEPHLKPETQRALEPAKQWGFLILLLLLIAPQLNRWFFEVVFWFVELSGTDSRLVSIGGQLTRFWSAWL